MSSPAQSATDVAFSCGPISLGCATFGREIDEAASFAMMDHAVARGVTHFDTASAYADGQSEQIIGRWLNRRAPAPSNPRPLIATKILPPYTLDAIAASVEKSARRLGVATIDLLYLHKWDSAVPAPETLTALDALVRTGRVRWLGVSNFTADELDACLQLQRSLGLTPFRVIQNNHNLAVRKVDAALATLCRAHGIAVITYSPLGAGFLTGKHRHGVQPGSRFEIVPGHQSVYFSAEPQRRLDGLEKISRETGHASATLALAWALHQPEVTSVLIGGRNSAQLDQAFAALVVNDSDLLSRLAAL